MGITITNTESSKYVRYNLPSNWKMVDASVRTDLPAFYNIDENENIRVKITGEWKGYPSDRLRIIDIINDENLFCKYTPPDIPKEETGLVIDDSNRDVNLAFVTDVAIAYDPLGRPSTDDMIKNMK